MKPKQTWDSNVRQAVLALNHLLTQYNNWGHADRAHIFSARNLLADEWMIQMCMEHYKKVRSICFHAEPGEPEMTECSRQPEHRCRSCGFKYCGVHATEFMYRGAHVPKDEEYVARICMMCETLDPYKLED